MKNNQEIRLHAKNRKVYLWRVSDQLGISYDTLIRKLRHELTEAEKNEIIGIIDKLSQKGE